jgi:hypothetical protein
MGLGFRLELRKGLKLAGENVTQPDPQFVQDCFQLRQRDVVFPALNPVQRRV